MKRGLLPALTLLLGSAVMGVAAASNAEEVRSEIGIATANIAWAKPTDAKDTFSEIAAAGFDSVRIGLKEPLPRSLAALKAAKGAGLKILVTFPLIDGAVAADGATPRAKSARFFPAYGLSQIDLPRFAARFQALADFAVAEQLPLIGIELGNELNWSGYNGDLPLSASGKVISTATDLPPAFLAGLDRYVAVFKTARQILAERPALRTVGLASAGLADINADFIHRSGADYVAPSLVHELFANRGVFDASDAVGIHLYEPLRTARVNDDRATLIANQLDGCGKEGFADKPCWITEFGSALASDVCAPDDMQRKALLAPLLAQLRAPGAAARVPFAFYYDWNDDKGFALERCGHLTALAETLSRANGANLQP